MEGLKKQPQLVKIEQNKRDLFEFSIGRWLPKLKQHSLKSEVVEFSAILIENYFFLDGMQQPETIFHSDTHSQSSDEPPQKHEISEETKT